MNFKKSKLYKTIVSGTPENVMKALWEYLKSGKDVNLKDETTGETLLHLLVNNGERFSSPDTIQAIYMLVCKDIEIDAQDSDGETGLHKVMRKPGAYRIMMALVRCGADTTIKNKKGKTAEDVLLEEKPEGWQEMYHWYNKFKPGLWSALSEPNPDRKTVERLLKNWCRLTCVKDGKVMNLKSLVKDDVHKIDVYHMLEEYENANEMALALQAGFGFIVKTWLKQGTDLLKTTNPNAMDHSYQYSFPSYPAVPRPLLMAAWETNSFDTVDVLMSMKPDTRVLFTYEEENKSPPKPLFFQLVCGAAIPTDEKILLRVFKECDLQARDSEGQSILHKVILHDQPVNRMNILLQYGASLTARDLKGKTPRDLAETLEKNTYTQCMDEFVIKLVKDKKFEEVEKLIFYSYDCICDIKDSSGRSILDIAKKVSQKMYEIIKLAPAKQSHMRKVFETVDDGKEEDLKKLLSCRKYHCIRDKCGRTLVHRAIKMKRKAIAIYLVNEYPESVHVGDTMDRTPLHYAALLLPDTELMECLISHGADENRADALGYVSKSYTKDKIGEQRLNDLVKSLNDLDLNIFITETNFESSFRKAIQDGNLEMVRQLVAGLQTFGDTSRYSSFLFDCIDYDQTDIAKFLILSGFNCEIYKQYQKCDPSDPMCAMMECDHVSVSLRERANEKKCDEVVSLIDSISNGKGHVHVNGIENKHVTHQSQNCTTVNG